MTSDPAGIHCGDDCQESYPDNTVVALRAHPGVKSYFVGWSGDCDANGQVTMDADKTCTAAFGYPVGGVVVPVNRLELIALRLSSGQASWLGLAVLTVVGAVGALAARLRGSGPSQ